MTLPKTLPNHFEQNDRTINNSLKKAPYREIGKQNYIPKHRYHQPMLKPQRQRNHVDRWTNHQSRRSSCAGRSGDCSGRNEWPECGRRGGNSCRKSCNGELCSAATGRSPPATCTLRRGTHALGTAVGRQRAKISFTCFQQFAI